MRLPTGWETHAGNCRLSERDAPGVLECRPRPERVAPVDSVVQQQPMQKKHVVHSHCGYPTTPNRCNGSDHFRVARISRETRAVGYPAISISNVFRFDDAGAARLRDRRQSKPLCPGCGAARVRSTKRCTADPGPPQIGTVHASLPDLRAFKRRSRVNPRSASAAHCSP
jgi:hypothetical protein